MGKHTYLEDINDLGKSEFDTLEDKIDMQLLGITDEDGNLLIEEADILQYCEESGYNGSKTRKKSNKFK